LRGSEGSEIVMKKNEKEFKKGDSGRIGEDFVKETLKSIRSLRTAEKALETLKRAGCDQESILTNLYLYCGPVPMAPDETMDIGLKQAKQFDKRVGALASRLKEDATELKTVAGEWPKYTGGHFSTELPSRMHSMAETLELLHGDSKSHRMAISGRNQHLFYLVQLVIAATGDQHYDQLADLIGAVQADPKGKKIPTPASLRKKVERFRARRRALAEGLAGEATAEAAEWKSSQSR
jgi:hypothetical protein